MFPSQKKVFCLISKILKILQTQSFAIIKTNSAELRIWQTSVFPVSIVRNVRQSSVRQLLRRGMRINIPSGSSSDPYLSFPLTCVSSVSCARLCPPVSSGIGVSPPETVRPGPEHLPFIPRSVFLFGHRQLFFSRLCTQRHFIAPRQEISWTLRRRISLDQKSVTEVRTLRLNDAVIMRFSFVILYKFSFVAKSTSSSRQMCTLKWDIGST